MNNSFVLLKRSKNECLKTVAKYVTFFNVTIELQLSKGDIRGKALKQLEG